MLSLIDKCVGTRRAIDRDGNMKQDVRTATEVDAYVGAQLKILRKSAKLSQTQLANKVGVTFQQIQKYERGTNRIGCLLYTSPSPRDQRGSRMPSSA